MSDRTQELQQRFNLIRQAMAEKYGSDQAFATASVAWLEAIQYTCKRAMKRVREDPGYSIDAAEEEIQTLLISFHKEMCEQLKVDYEKAIELSRMFREVLHDITGYGGK